MAPTNPKKTELHGAAAAAQQKADAAKVQPIPAMANTSRKPSKGGNKSDSSKKSR